MPHGDADHGVTTPRSTFYDQGRFGRLFPTLPPFASDTPLVRAALTELGQPSGLMDADDVLSDPIALITNPALSVDNPDNPRLSAGMTFLGQFLDHDMTFDPTSSLARAQDPESIRNFRIPALDLDSVYGGGPGVSPHLYNRNVDAGRTTLLLDFMRHIRTELMQRGRAGPSHPLRGVRPGSVGRPARISRTPVA